MSFKFCHFETIWKISIGHCGPLTPTLQFRHLPLQSGQVCWVTFSHWFLQISFDICKFAFLSIRSTHFSIPTPGQSSKVGAREGTVQPEAAAARAWERRAQLVCIPYERVTKLLHRLWVHHRSIHSEVFIVFSETPKCNVQIFLEIIPLMTKLLGHGSVQYTFFIWIIGEAFC